MRAKSIIKQDTFGSKEKRGETRAKRVDENSGFVKTRAKRVDENSGLATQKRCYRRKTTEIGKKQNGNA